MGAKEFVFDAATARVLSQDAGARHFIKPIATTNHLLSGRFEDSPEYTVDLGRCASESEARLGGAAFEYLKRHVFPFVQTKASAAGDDHYSEWLRTWWRPWRPRLDFLTNTDRLARVIVCGRVLGRSVFQFVSTKIIPTDTLQVFAFDDDYTFGVLQSGFHWSWLEAKGGRVRADIRYTKEVWLSFPWPQDPTDDQLAHVAAAARELRRIRAELMATNGWSLRALYQAAEVDGLHPIKDAQGALDTTVAAAYGMPAGQAPTAFLLELNQLVAEDEEQNRKVRGPGLPDHLDPKDPRWMSTDCIEPPPMEN